MFLSSSLLGNSVKGEGSKELNCYVVYGEGSWGLRQGLNRVARKVGGAWPARCGGDFRSPRKPAGPATGNCGLPVKARSRPNSKNGTAKRKGQNKKALQQNVAEPFVQGMDGLSNQIDSSLFASQKCSF
jgi:hypothetical protein